MKKKRNTGVNPAPNGMTGGTGRYGSVGTPVNSGTDGSSSFDNEERNRLPNDDFASSDRFGRKRTESDRVKDRMVDHPDESNIESGSDFGRDSRNRR